MLSFSVTISFAQTLPFDFETTPTTATFVDFDGGTASVVSNPFSGGINTSAKVGQIVRNGGQPWAGSKIQLSSPMDFATNNTISMKVYTTAPVGTIVKLKFEGTAAAERDAITTTSNAWETLTWDFTATQNGLDYIVFMFDFGVIGDGGVNSTFYFDDVEHLFGGYQIDMPVDFQSNTVNYTLTDFGDNQSSLVVDPTFAQNTVVKVIKPTTAPTWAGTTIGTPSGFLNDIPLTLTDSKINIRVWSPTAGTPIRVKVEDSNDNTLTCETQTNTTVAGEWEVMTFDFANEATGTALLSFGLTNGWTYNMMSIFFNYGTDCAAAGEKIYYFDDVKFGAPEVAVAELTIGQMSIYPNPFTTAFTVQNAREHIQAIEVFDVNGRLVYAIKLNSNTHTFDASALTAGFYTCKIATSSAQQVVRLIKTL